MDTWYLSKTSIYQSAFRCRKKARVRSYSNIKKIYATESYYTYSFTYFGLLSWHEYGNYFCLFLGGVICLIFYTGLKSCCCYFLLFSLPFLF